MNLTWAQYNYLYYFIQFGLFIAIYYFVVIIIPYPLMGWMIDTVLFLKDDDKQDKSTSTSTDENTYPNENTYSDENTDTNKAKNWCSCCCLWMPIEDTDKRDYGFHWRSFWMGDKQTNSKKCWHRWCGTRWLFKDRNRNKNKNRDTAINWNTSTTTINNWDKNTDTITNFNTKTNTITNCNRSTNTVTNCNRSTNMVTNCNTNMNTIIYWNTNTTTSWNTTTITNWNTDTNDNTNKKIPPWCTCSYIREFFRNLFQCKCSCWTRCGCKCNSKDCENCLINLSHCCYECYCGDEDLKNKLLPHHHRLNLQNTAESKYCGFIYLNLERIGVYLLLCTSLWCAAVAFFEEIILGYATAKSGDSCPSPKRATPATVVDCFIFEHQFDTYPNSDSPQTCNRSMSITFPGGYSAGCFAWIFADVEVADVIEELGICAGIVALYGTLVAIMGYLCQKHEWRLVFDIVAVMAVAAIPILIYKNGDIPFMTYIILGSLFADIGITQYLLHYVPFLTWLCVANRIFRCIKYRDKPNTSRGKILCCENSI